MLVGCFLGLSLYSDDFDDDFDDEHEVADVNVINRRVNSG